MAKECEIKSYIKDLNISERARNFLNNTHNDVFNKLKDSKSFRYKDGYLFTKKNDYNSSLVAVNNINREYGEKVASIVKYAKSPNQSIVKINTSLMLKHFEKDVRGVDFFKNDWRLYEQEEKLYQTESLQNTPLIKEGVDFVFEQNPELAKIGKQEQYSQYLDTIFPDSQIKDIVLHNSPNKFEKFNVNRGRLGVGVYFGLGYKIYNTGKYNYNALLNITNLKRYDKGEFVITANKLYPSQDEYSTKPQDTLKSADKASGVDGYVSTSPVGTEFLVFEPEQIHILSSKADIQGFKDFMVFKNSEFSKYGTYQQFRDFISHKSSIEIENNLIQTGKIDRVC